MIIKSFAAESASAALKQVRDEMGGDAIVLKTRQVPGAAGRLSYEVTACLERPTVGQVSAILPDPAAPKETATQSRRLKMRRGSESAPPAAQPTPAESDLRERLAEMEHKLDRLLNPEPPLPATPSSGELEQQRLTRLMQDADLEEGLIASVIGGIDATADADACRERAESLLTSRLADCMLPDFKLQPGDRVAIIGPAGAGKSSVLGKLAAQSVARDKHKVTLLTLDNRKLGAFDEVCTYAAVLGADVADTNSGETPLDLPDDGILLIDTPAITSDPDDLTRLRKRLDEIKPTHRLAVFSALTRTADQTRFAAAARELKATHAAATMTDLTHRAGSVIAAATISEARLSVVCDSPGGIGTAAAPDPLKMARMILGAEVVLG